MGIHDVGTFVSTAFSILTIFGQTVVVCQSYNAVLGGPPQRAQTQIANWHWINVEIWHRNNVDL